RGCEADRVHIRTFHCLTIKSGWPCAQAGLIGSAPGLFASSNNTDFVPCVKGVIDTQRVLVAVDVRTISQRLIKAFDTAAETDVGRVEPIAGRELVRQWHAAKGLLHVGAGADPRS